MIKRDARYTELMTVGIRATCRHCGFIETHICPKATGWSPNEWEMNCQSCHHFLNNAFDGYKPAHRGAVEALRKAFDEFLAGTNLAELDARIGDLAARYDRLIQDPACECGSMVSIKAKPRCKQCGEIIFDSYFHYA